jgi:hypothetical protein
MLILTPPGGDWLMDQYKYQQRLQLLLPSLSSKSLELQGISVSGPTLLKQVDTYCQQLPPMPHLLMHLVVQRSEDPATACVEEYDSRCYNLSQT